MLGTQAERAIAVGEVGFDACWQVSSSICDDAERVARSACGTTIVAELLLADRGQELVELRTKEREVTDRMVGLLLGRRATRLAVDAIAATTFIGRAGAIRWSSRSRCALGAFGTLRGLGRVVPLRQQ